MKNQKNVSKMSKAELIAYIAQLEAAGKSESKSKPKTAVFMKYNPETGKRDIAKACTEAQKAAWEKGGNRYEKREEGLAKFEKARAAYKPSKKFIDWLKANPTCTRDQAKEQGFIGTRQDLKDLKATLRK